MKLEVWNNRLTPVWSNSTTTKTTLLVLLIAGLSTATPGQADTREHRQEIIAVEFNADGPADIRTVYHPQTGEPIASDVLCFDGTLTSIASGRIIGRAVDCLDPKNLDNAFTKGNSLDDSIALIGTTVFELHRGTIISQGNTTVRPVTWPDQPNTHITGAIPQPGANSIKAGTHGYSDASGSVRLSGSVDMRDFVTETGEGTISFSCLFVIKLD